MPTSADGIGAKNRRVLLLEAEPFLRESLAYTMVGSGYTVVAVRDTAEGLREILNGEFTVLLYDPEMPGMSAEKFYHSVKRVEPDLCERFLFTIDESNDARANRFIRKIDGFVLRRPFEQMDLLDALFTAEARGTFQDVIGRASADPILSRVSLIAENLPADENAAPHPVPVVKEAPKSHTPAVVAPVPDPPSLVLPESDTPHRAGGFTRWLALAALLLILALMVGLWEQHADARDRFEAVSAKRAEFVTEWTEISRNLEEAISLRSNLDLPEMLGKRITAFQTQERWTPILSAAVPKGDDLVETLEIEARGETENSSAWEVRIHGLAGGVEPRKTVERFRVVLESNLRVKAKGRPVRTRFESTGATTGTPPDHGPTEFILIATLGSVEPLAGFATEGH